MFDQALELATAGKIDKAVEELLDELGLVEKVAMMSGRGFRDEMRGSGNRLGSSTYQAGGGNDRLGIPTLQFSDGPRGVITGNSTCFPVAMARGAAWDVDLEERIGEAIGRELRAQGGNLFGGVCINVLRHPAWGRAQETYGEDPWHLGEMGSALVRGVQRHGVIATIKHFAANSIERSRFRVDVRLGQRALREVYLPHFKRCIDAGAGSVMSAYNKVNGEWCGHHQELLVRILKEEWGFDGFVHSDWLRGVHGPEAAAAGLDIENPEAEHFGELLVAAVEDGRVPAAAIDDAVGRILRTLLRFRAQPDRETYTSALVACPDHVSLAREAAEKSAVLLRNEGPVLPLERREVRRLAVIGKLAAKANLGDLGSSRVRPPYVVTPLQGLESYLGETAEVLFDDGSVPEQAAALAETCDAAVVVVGTTHRDEGEFISSEMLAGRTLGGDREILTLHRGDEDLLLAVTGANAATSACSFRPRRATST